MYGLALMTTKKFADENPETVRGVVKALNQGTKDTIASPQKALEVLKARDPMMKLDIEKVRLDIALGLTNTPTCQERAELGDPEKFKRTIDAIVGAYQLSAARIRQRSTPKDSCPRPPIACRQEPKLKRIRLPAEQAQPVTASGSRTARGRNPWTNCCAFRA